MVRLAAVRLAAPAAAAALGVVAIDMGDAATPPTPHWSAFEAALARTPALFAALWGLALAGLAATAKVAPKLGVDAERATDAVAFAAITGAAALSAFGMMGEQLLLPENLVYAAATTLAAVAAVALAYFAPVSQGRWSFAGVSIWAGVWGLWVAQYRFGWERPAALALAAAVGAIVWVVWVRAEMRRTATAVTGVGALFLCAGAWSFSVPTTRLIGVPAPAVIGASAPDARRILLFSIDTLRRDALSTYNPEVTDTPSFDRLAKDSVVFNAAYSASSWTLPAVASFLTGEHARTHGTIGSGRRIPDGLATLAERLSDHGFATAAAVRNPWLTYRTGFHRGFDGYADFATDSMSAGERVQYQLYDHPSVPLRELAQEWMTERGERPRFFWLHLLAPHAPYSPLPEYRPAGPPPAGLGWVFGDAGYMAERLERHRGETTIPPPARETQEWARKLYYAGVRTADRALGRLLASLEAEGVYDEMLIIVVADHGEEIWDHGKLGHRMQLFDEVTRVPLMIKPPGGRAGVVESTVSTRNLFHTVLDYAGLEAGSECSDGFSLRQLVEGEPEGEDGRDILIQSEDGRHEQVDGLVAAGRVKVGRGVGEVELEVYDLDRDPEELAEATLSKEDEAALAARMDARLAAAQAARDCYGLTEALTDESSSEGRWLEQLRNLGYIQ